MTGTELLAMLKAHPKACGRIGVTQAHIDFDWGDLYPHAFEDIILGKTTRWCDEHWIDVIQSSGHYIASTGCDEHYQELSSRESRLAANLAAMEAHTT